MSNIAWKSDLFHQEVSPRVSRPYLSVVSTPLTARLGTETRKQVSAPSCGVGLKGSTNSARTLETGVSGFLAPRSLAGEYRNPGSANKAGINDRAQEGGKKPAATVRVDQAGEKSVPMQRKPAARFQTREAGDEGLRRILLALIVMFSLIILGEVIFQMGIAPELTIKSVELDIEPGVPLDQVQSLLGLKGKLLYYACDEILMTEVLRSLPQVRDARVEKRFPDVLAIHASARKALVQARVRGRPDETGNLGAAGQSAVLVDQDGCAFAWAAGPDQNLPVLSGIDFENFRLGLKLPQAIRDFLGDLEAIRTSNPEIYQAFSEFRLVPLGQNSVEILVYTMNSPIPVRINNRLTADNALYILRTMAYVPGQSLGKDVVEVDFRTRNVILRKGEN